jgi:hypothetical protein
LTVELIDHFGYFGCRAGGDFLYVGQELRDKLADTAVQHGFHKL